CLTLGPCAVLLLAGAKLVFAIARDWPGWSRSGKGDDEAIEALLAYAPRYRDVLRGAKVSPLPPGTDAAPEAVERHAGGSGTDYGVPGVPATNDGKPLTRAELRRPRATR